MYSIAYSVNVGFQFSIFETMLLYVENYRYGTSKILHANSDVAFAAAISATISSYLTNPLEYLAINK